MGPPGQRSIPPPGPHLPGWLWVPQNQIRPGFGGDDSDDHDQQNDREGRLDGVRDQRGPQPAQRHVQAFHFGEAGQSAEGRERGLRGSQQAFPEDSGR